MVVHLFNDLNTTSNHGLCEVDVPLREESIPIHGIKISFKGLDIQRFHVEPEGIDVVPVVEGDLQTVEIPAVAIHSMLVAER